MATTTNLGLTKPTVGGDSDAWGGYLNNDLDYIDLMFSKSGTSVTFLVDNQDISSSSYKLDQIKMGDDRPLQFGDAPDYWFVHNTGTTPDQFELKSSDVNGGGTDGIVFSISDGTDDVAFTGKISTAQVDILAEGDLRLQDASGGQYVGFDAPATVSGSYTLTLPAAVGLVDQVLSLSNTDGTLQWATPEVGDITEVIAGAGLTGGGAGPGAVTLNAVGTSNRITVNANDIDIASSYVGQSSITTLGTIATGTWNGTAITGDYIDVTTSPLANTKIWIGDSSGDAQEFALSGDATMTAGGVVTVTAPAGTLTGTTLKSTVVSSSLTSVGTITTGVWNGTAIANANLANSTVSYGGVSVALGASDATPAFNLSDATAYTGDSSLVTSGALNAGSITSGFGAIDVGSSNIDGGTITADTALVGTTLTVNKGSNTSVIELGGSPGANWEGDILFNTSNSATNWRLASNRVTAGAFTITPSTAAGGSTYTTPRVTVTDGAMKLGGSDTIKLEFLNAAGTLRSFLTLDSTSLDIDTDSALIFSPNNSERARIDDSGRLGLGTASPHSYYSGSNKFVIANTGGSTGMTFATSNTGQARIDFAEGTSGAEQYRGTISYNHAATESEGYLRFVAGGAEALRLGSNYVLMGNLPTSDPGVATALYNDSGTLKISAG